jgi:hypothetical protein
MIKTEIKSSEICSLETAELYRQQQATKFAESLTDKSLQYLRLLASFFKS